MADLQIAPPRERSVAPALLIALFVLAVVAGAVFYLNPHRVSDLQVTDVQTFAPHTTIHALQGARDGNMRVLNGDTTQSEDNLYVVATVHLTDRLRLPLYLTDATAHVTFADGTEADAPMVPIDQLSRLEGVFPALTPLAHDPVAALDQQVSPAQTLTGTLVFPFPGKTAQAWSTKKAATLTLQLRNQEEQTARLP